MSKVRSLPTIPLKALSMVALMAMAACGPTSPGVELAIEAVADVQLAENETRTIDLKATGANGAVTFAFFGSHPGLATLAGSTLTLAPGSSDGGTWELGLEARDTEGHSAHAIAKVVVTEVDVPPTLEGLSSIDLVRGEIQAISLRAFDADGDPIVLALEAGGPRFATLDVANALVWLKPDERDASGTSTIGVTATAREREARLSIAVTVREAGGPRSPVVEAVSQSLDALEVQAGTAVERAPTLRVTSTDPDDDVAFIELELSRDGTFTGVPTQRLPVAAGGEATFTPGELHVGAWAWQARAIDATALASPWRPFAEGSPAFVIAAVPITGHATIAEGEFSNHSHVRILVEVDATGGQVPASLELSSDATNWTFPRPFTPEVTFDIAPVEGPATIFVRVSDLLGNTGTFSATTILDTTAPTGAIALLGAPREGLADGLPEGLRLARVPDLTVAVDARDEGSGLARVCLSNDAIAFPAESCFEASGPADLAWSIGSADGAHLVVARLEDRAGNASLAHAIVTLDTRGPTLSLVTDSVLTSEPVLPIAVDVRDASGLAEICWSQDGASESCEPPTSTYTWQIAGEDGAHELVARAVDLAGNTTTASVSVTLDRLAPTLALSFDGLAPVGGSYYTRTQSLGLALTSPTASAYQASDDGLVWGEWQDFASPVEHALGAGEGEHAIHIRTRDAAGNVSPAQVMTVVLDTRPPVAPANPRPFVINNDDAYTAVTSASFALRNVSDATSGLYQMQFANEQEPPAALEPFAESRAAWTLATGTGTKTVTAHVFDRAGNELVLTDAIALDPAQPTIAATVATTTVRSAAVQVAVTVRYTGTAVTQLCGRNEGGAEVCTLPIPANGVATNVNWTLSAGDGPKTVTFRADRGSAPSATTTLTLLLDATAPVIGLTSVALPAPGYAAPGTYDVQWATTGVETSPITAVCTTLVLSSGTPSCAQYVDLPEPGHARVTVNTTSGSLYLGVRDAAGNASALALLAVVTADGTAPTGTYTIDEGRASTNDPELRLTFNVTDGSSGSGVDRIVALRDGVELGSWSATTTSATVTITGPDATVTLSVIVRDRAGNQRELPSRSIVLDRRPPSLLGARLSYSGGLQTIGDTQYADDRGLGWSVLANFDEDVGGCLTLETGSCTPSTPSNPSWSSSSVTGPSVGFEVRRLSPVLHMQDRAGNKADFAVPGSYAIDGLAPPTPSFRSVTARHHFLDLEIVVSADSVKTRSHRLYWAIGPTVGAGASYLDVTGSLSFPVLDGLEYSFFLESSDVFGNRANSATTQATAEFPWKVANGGPMPADVGAVTTFQQRAIAVGNKGLAAVSEDVGARWTLRDTGIDGNLVAVASGSALDVVAASASELVVSRDGGRTWTKAAAGTLGEVLELVWEGAGRYWAATSNGLWLLTMPASGATLERAQKVTISGVTTDSIHVAATASGTPILFSAGNKVHVGSATVAFTDRLAAPGKVLGVGWLLPSRAIAWSAASPYAHTSVDGTAWTAVSNAPQLLGTRSMAVASPSVVALEGTAGVRVVPLTCTGSACTAGAASQPVGFSIARAAQLTRTATQVDLVGLEGGFVRTFDPAATRLVSSPFVSTPFVAAAPGVVWGGTSDGRATRTLAAPLAPTVTSSAPPVALTMAAMAAVSDTEAWSAGYDGPASSRRMMLVKHVASGTSVSSVPLAPLGAGELDDLACSRPSSAQCLAAGTGGRWAMVKGTNVTSGTLAVADTAALAVDTTLEKAALWGTDGTVSVLSLASSPPVIERTFTVTGTPRCLAMRNGLIMGVTAQGRVWRRTLPELKIVSVPGLIFAGLPTRCLAAPADTLRWVLAEGPGEIWRSTDQGLTWRLAESTAIPSVISPLPFSAFSAASDVFAAAGPDGQLLYSGTFAR